MTVRLSIENFLEHLGDAVILVSADAEIVFANHACLKLFGYQPVEFLGQSIDIVVEPEYRGKHASMVRRFIAERSEPKRMTSRAALNCLAKNGEVFAARISISTIEIEGNFYGVAVIHDYSSIQQWAQEIEQKAITDPLTMLYNRHYLNTIILPENRWLNAHEAVAVLYVDLDDFKPVNDNYGHAFGDFVLKTVAMRMKENLRQDDLIFRVGGDEFVIMLALGKEGPPIEITHGVAESLSLAISAPIVFDDEAVKVGVSIGIGLYPQDFNDIEIVIKLADKAMYQAKNKGDKIFYVSQLPNILKP